MQICGSIDNGNTVAPRRRVYIGIAGPIIVFDYRENDGAVKFTCRRRGSGRDYEPPESLKVADRRLVERKAAAGASIDSSMHRVILPASNSFRYGLIRTRSRCSRRAIRSYALACARSGVMTIRSQEFTGPRATRSADPSFRRALHRACDTN